MRRLAATLVCFFIIYAGAAQALVTCLGHNGHSDHQFEGHHSGMVATHDHSQTPSWPIIHCPTMEQPLGPALRVASVNLKRFDLVTSVHASFVSEPASPASRNSLWQEALFKRSLAFSLPTDLARHLFLSILQI